MPLSNKAKTILIAEDLEQSILNALKERYGAENIHVRLHKQNENGEKIDPKSADKSRRTAKDIIELKPDIVFVRSTDFNKIVNGEEVPENDMALKELLKFNPSAVFIRGGAGTENLDPVKSKGFIVENTPGANAMGVVDLTFGLMGKLIANDKLNSQTLSANPSNTYEILNNIVIEREILGGDYKKSRNETLNEETLNILKSTPIEELQGKTLFIMGASGDIGRRLIKYAKAAGMGVLAEKARSVNEDFAKEHGIKLVASLQDGFKQADVISVNCALKDETKGIITQELIDSMKQGAAIINTARAAVFAKNLDLTNVKSAIDDSIETVEKLGIKGVDMISPKRGAKTIQSDDRVGEMTQAQIIDIIDRNLARNEVLVPNSAIRENLKVLEAGKTIGAVAALS